MEFLTPDVFNRLIIANLVIGVIFAAARFYRDMTRPLSDSDENQRSLQDTQPNRMPGKK